MSRRHVLAALGITTVMLLPAVGGGASTPGADVRLTNDLGGGYVSNYTAATGMPYTDATLAECGKARGRQNEPSVAIDPRNPQVIVGSSNDYCGVYENTNPPVPVGPIWLGYYRSENGGAKFQSSLVPGYPGDTSPYKARSKVRTASAGDPVLAWDNHGRLYAGSESSGDAAGSPKGFGDVFVATYENPGGPEGPRQLDGKEFKRSVIVAKGSSSPASGKFNDKTAIEVDRTGGPCDGDVYFSYSRFTGKGGVAIYVSRSTDQGRTFAAPKKVSAGIHDVQFPDIAVTGNGHVYVTFRQFEGNGKQTDNVIIVKSTDCGRSFASPKVVTPFLRHDAVDVSAPVAGPASAHDDPVGEDESDATAGLARDCGDFDAACESGYTFFRHDTGPRSTADQKDPAREWVYVVYDAGKPAVENTGTTYGTITPGKASQGGIHFVRYDGATGTRTAPALVSAQPRGHQIFGDIAADSGLLHTIWWDSRNDGCYSVTRPIGNCADRRVVPALDVYGASSSNRGVSWSVARQITDVQSNGNFEQFADRTVPFGGDYLWVDAVGTSSFGTWTDWRDTVAGVDQREAAEDDVDNADVLQCRTVVDGSFTSDQCPRRGGLDQNIYGDKTP